MLTFITEAIDEPAASSAALMASRVLRVWVFGSRPVWPAVQTRSPTRTAGLRMGDGCRPGTVMSSRFIEESLPVQRWGRRPLYQPGSRDRRPDGRDFATARGRAPGAARPGRAGLVSTGRIVGRPGRRSGPRAGG